MGTTTRETMTASSGLMETIVFISPIAPIRPLKNRPRDRELYDSRNDIARIDAQNQKQSRNGPEGNQHAERRFSHLCRRLMMMPVRPGQGFEIPDLDDTEKQNGIDKTAQQQGRHKSIMPGNDTAGDQVPFTEKTA